MRFQLAATDVPGFTFSVSYAKQHPQHAAVVGMMLCCQPMLC